MKELLLTALGPQHSYPHLLAVIDNDLIIYKAYQYPLSSVQGHLQLRFSKVSHYSSDVIVHNKDSYCILRGRVKGFNSTIYRIWSKGLTVLYTIYGQRV